LTIDQAVELLELTPPADLRAIQLARRRMAKRWHPDRAAPGQRLVHDRQMRSVNAAYDLLEARVEADGPITALDVRVSADVHRRHQAEAGARAYEAAQRQDPGRRAGTEPERSIVYRYVRSATYPEWGVGSVVDVRFTGEGDEIQRWARVEFASGTYTLPLDNLTFVDFARRERDAERAERFLVAARDAIAQGDHPLAAQRLVYARNAAPRDPEVLGLLADEYRRCGRLLEAGRTVRDWIRVEPDNPAAHRLARVIYAEMGAHDLAADASRAERAARRRRRRALAAAALLVAGMCGCGASGGRSHAAHARSIVDLPTAPVHLAARPKRRPHRPRRRPSPPRVAATLVAHGPRRGHEVALTFDADMTQAMLAAVRSGRPTIGYDPAIVSELRASRTPATIFMTGLWPSAHAGPARELAADPLFEIENHTYDHAAFAPPCYGLPGVPSADAKASEVERTAQVVAGLTGSEPRYFRFPGGCHRAGDVRLVASLGEQPVQWDVISGDAYLRDPAAVARQTLSRVQPGSIVVMHLVGAPTAPATAGALRTILPALHARGLRPVKLGRLLRAG
jgi:peptidoglycan/xylan/chitin deacetylase (PgdA/CDA1 family)/tetratricopeptide (TPR) repeat protein